jgi:hypothetical protein
MMTSLSRSLSFIGVVVSLALLMSDISPAIAGRIRPPGPSLLMLVEDPAEAYQHSLTKIPLDEALARRLHFPTPLANRA